MFQQRSRTCPRCHQERLADENYCGICGMALIGHEENDETVGIEQAYSVHAPMPVSSVPVPASHANISTQIVKSHRSLFTRSVILLVGLAFFVIAGGSIAVFAFTRINPQNSYPPFETQVMTDALSDNGRGHRWPEFSPNSIGGSCQFRAGAYHVSASNAAYGNYCLVAKSAFRDFAFEVQMKIIQGNCGGIVFRYQPIPHSNNGTFYYFEVCQNGMYALWKSYDETLIMYTASAAIHTGHYQSNVMAVVANHQTLDLYMNHHKIDSVSDSSYSQGEIGVEATYRTDPEVASRASPTEVVFSDVKVWT